MRRRGRDTAEILLQGVVVAAIAAGSILAGMWGGDRIGNYQLVQGLSFLLLVSAVGVAMWFRARRGGR